MTATDQQADPDYRPGDVVQCMDDSDGAHFLRRGYRYVVHSTQRDAAGGLRLNLCGMARAWECRRFRRVGGSPPRLL